MALYRMFEKQWEEDIKNYKAKNGNNNTELNYGDKIITKEDKDEAEMMNKMINKMKI